MITGAVGSLFYRDASPVSLTEPYRLGDVSDGFPFLPPEIVQNLFILFSLVLFGSINNQPERDDFVFPLHVLEFSRSAIRCQTAEPWR